MASNIADVCSAFHRCSVLSQVPLNRTKCVCSCGSSARDACAVKAAPTKLPVTRSCSSNATLADACGGELLQFAERHCGGFLMRLDDAPVIHRNRENGHGLGRSTLEVKEDAPVPELLWGQLLPCHRVHVVTELEEDIAGDTSPGFNPIRSAP